MPLAETVWRKPILMRTGKCRSATVIMSRALPGIRSSFVLSTLAQPLGPVQPLRPSPILAQNGEENNGSGASND